jgi:hypothetical protein
MPCNIDTSFVNGWVQKTGVFGESVPKAGGVLVLFEPNLDPHSLARSDRSFPHSLSLTPGRGSICILVRDLKFSRR